MTGRFAPIAAAAFVALAACGGEKTAGDDAPAAPAAREQNTLAAAIVAAPHLGQFAAALKDTNLAGALDGAVPYTVLAPRDEAFARLGPAAGPLREPEQRAVMAEIIREHVVPGYMTPRDIAASIEAHGGKPVTMKTAGDGEITFARDGEALVLTSSSGETARIAGDAIRASNGAAIPIDALLKRPPG